ncbi:MAG: hypothetical protein HON78_02850 [Legionellales bacterium]|jgi:hypothetical protein|nr:hypothetical protein [Legionellales bacterium]
MKINTTDLPSFKHILMSLFTYLIAAIIIAYYIAITIALAIPSLLYLITGASLFFFLNSLVLTGPALLSSSLGITLAAIVIVNLITDIIINPYNIKDISIYSLKSSAVLFIISATAFTICTACGLPPVINASFTSLMLQKSAANIALLTAAIAKYPLTLAKTGWQPESVFSKQVITTENRNMEYGTNNYDEPDDIDDLYVNAGQVKSSQNVYSPL